jgi:pimeloyl-ACP methyl ester carboxylesterase
VGAAQAVRPRGHRLPHRPGGFRSPSDLVRSPGQLVELGYQPARTGGPRALAAARDRYRLATSAPRTAWGFQSRWRTVRGVATHARCSLASPSGALPLVLVHGLAVSHRYLMPLAAELAGHHPVHVVDLPGFGLSGDPGRVLGVAERADDLAAWLEAGGLPPVAMLGNSFGCQIAVELAVRHPDRVAGLVLVGPTMDPSARTTPRQILRWLWDTVREDPLQLPILLRDIRDAGPHRVVGTLAHALRDPIEAKLPQVTVPVLVTRGSSEPIVPSAWAQTATRLLPLGELAVVLGPTTPTTAPPTTSVSSSGCSSTDGCRPTAAKPTERETLAPGRVLVSSLQAPAR